MRPWLTRLHRWIGLALALPVVAIAATGTALVFHDAIVLARLGPLVETASEKRIEAPASDLAAIEQLAGADGWRTIKLPQPGFPLYRIWLNSGEQAYFAAGDDAFIDRFTPGTRIESLLFEIHTHLLAGPIGERLVGAMAIGLLALLFLGLAIWWPGRRLLRKRHFVPTSTSPRQMLRSHSAWGAVMILLATLSVATGAMLVFSQPTLSALKWLMPDDAAPRAAPPVVAPGAAIDWHQVVRNAAAVFADDQLVFVIAPQAERAHLTIRARRAAEWHPNGRSEILLEPGTGNVLAVRDATAAAAAERVFNKIYPLHVARGSVAPLQPLTVLTGAVLCGLALTGLAGWLGRERIRRRVAAQSLTGRGPASEPANRTNG